MELLKAHGFSMMCILCIIYVGVTVYMQFKYKKKGVVINAQIADYKQQSGTYFPIFKFEYNGSEHTVKNYIGDREPENIATSKEIYYIPGNDKYVMRVTDVKIQAWQIGLAVVAPLYIIFDFLR